MLTATVQKKTCQTNKYRGRIAINDDILKVLMDHGSGGALISVIARMANLSHRSVAEACQRLAAAGLVDSVRDDSNHIFRISENGIKFFFEFQRFLSILQTMNLRY